MKPTIGRIVHFYPYGKTSVEAGEQPRAAIIAYVHSDNCVNLGFFDQNGQSGLSTSVQLLGVDEPLPDSQSAFCIWPPRA